jgi:hypothetical protein
VFRAPEGATARSAITVIARIRKHSIFFIEGLHASANRTSATTATARRSPGAVQRWGQVQSYGRRLCNCSVSHGNARPLAVA